jgi:hypothetical protein
VNGQENAMASMDGGLFISGTPDSYILAPPVAPSISIMSEDNLTPLVTIHPNGTLEYGPGYTPDEAARRFWDAMRHLAPARCEHCGHVPGHQAD